MTDRAGFFKISPRTIKVWRLSNAISYLFYFGIPAIYYGILGADGFHGWFIIFITSILAVIWCIAVFWFPYHNWRNWHYTINMREIELKNGIFFKTHTLIPLSRVQHVNTRQGPILRWYHLSTVTISTAATTHEIQGLDSTLADRLRKQISTYARLAEEDV